MREVQRMYGGQSSTDNLEILDPRHLPEVEHMALIEEPQLDRKGRSRPRRKQSTGIGGKPKRLNQNQNPNVSSAKERKPFSLSAAPYNPQERDLVPHDEFVIERQRIEARMHKHAERVARKNQRGPPHPGERIHGHMAHDDNDSVDSGSTIGM